MSKTLLITFKSDALSLLARMLWKYTSVQDASAAVPRIPRIALGLLAAASLSLSPLQGKIVCSSSMRDWAPNKVLWRANAVALHYINMLTKLHPLQDML